MDIGLIFIVAVGIVLIRFYHKETFRKGVME